MSFLAQQVNNEQKDGTPPPEIPPKQTEEEIEKIIDSVLKDDDHNNDGFISFHEFMSDRRVAAAEAAAGAGAEGSVPLPPVEDVQPTQNGAPADRPAQ